MSLAQMRLELLRTLASIFHPCFWKTFIYWTWFGQFWTYLEVRGPCVFASTQPYLTPLGQWAIGLRHGFKKGPMTWTLMCRLSNIWTRGLAARCQHGPSLRSEPVSLGALKRQCTTGESSPVPLQFLRQSQGVVQGSPRVPGAIWSSSRPGKSSARCRWTIYHSYVTRG